MGAILVTGGAGFIGGHVVRLLRERGSRVIILDLVPLSGDLDFVEGDVGDCALIERIVKAGNVSAIMHFAGSIRVEESLKNPLKYYRDNVETSIKLLAAAIRGGIRHFVFSSSAAVYGMPAALPVREDSYLRPLSPYGHSKRMVEQVLADVAAAHSTFSFVALRYFNVAGGGYRLEKHPTHLIRAVVAVALRRKEYLPIYGTDYPTPDGTAVRDFIHVLDLATAHLDALHHLEGGGASDVFNVGYGHGYSVLQVHKAAQQITGKSIPLKYEPRRPGDPASIVADCTKARHVLNWEPRYSELMGMIRHQYDWERLKNPPAA